MPLVSKADSDEALIMGGGAATEYYVNHDKKKVVGRDRIVLFGGRLSLTKRQLGILGAVINGGWGGLYMIPMHYARHDGLSGAAYLISFGGGALAVNAAIWIILIAYRLYEKKGNVTEAIESLPKWHFEQLWKAGLGAGLLYSLGNFAAILAVNYLGQATGFSFCQMQLFVSGLWGVFYFREIKGTDTILKWFLAAATAIIGIIWLSYEHVGEPLH